MEMQEKYWVRTGHGKSKKSWNFEKSFFMPGKSWNFEKSFFRPGKSWIFSFGHGKLYSWSWKMNKVNKIMDNLDFFKRTLNWIRICA